MTIKLTFILLFFSFIGNLAAQDAINWLTMEEALAAQQQEPRKILIDAYTDWCYPCKLMDKNTFQNKEVVHYINSHYYAVKFNAEGNEVINYQGETFNNEKYDPKRSGKRNYQHPFAQYLKIHAYPTTVFLSETGDLIAPIPGYLKPTELELYLELMRKDDYKKINSAEEMKTYQKSFIPTFKN